MKWVTYRSPEGERTGVLSGDEIFAVAPGTTLLELIGEGPAGLRAAGEAALASPDAVVALADVTLAAPIPRPPSIRDSLCFLDHMRNCQEATGAAGCWLTPGTASRRFTSPVRQRYWDRMTKRRQRPEVLGRTSNWRSPRSSAFPVAT